jgi:hypothetical protein
LVRPPADHADFGAVFVSFAGVYERSDERTKRGYNQAFCERIKIKARWDDEAKQTSVEVVGVELTDPFAVLLADKD